MALNTDKFRDIEAIDTKKTLTGILKVFSGAAYSRNMKYNLFYKRIAFKGACGGVGCSTIVANTALALADLGLSVCVFDTSILHPSQDVLLKTSLFDIEKERRTDWFDMIYTTDSVLNVSKLNSRVSVLSFGGKDRTVLDMLSIADSEQAVEIAISQVEDKFDLILMDLCEETTNINVTAMQKAQQVIQVWSDSVTCVASMENVITNQTTLACPMDKMRYVVENKTIDDTMGSLDVLYNEYRFKMLSHCTLSYEIERVAQMKPLWKYPTAEETIIMFNMMIVDIVCLICGISREALDKGELREKTSMEYAKAVNADRHGLKGLFTGSGKKGRVNMEEFMDNSNMDKNLMPEMVDGKPVIDEEVRQMSAGVGLAPAIGRGGNKDVASMAEPEVSAAVEVDSGISIDDGETPSQASSGVSDETPSQASSGVSEGESEASASSGKRKRGKLFGKGGKNK